MCRGGEGSRGEDPDERLAVVEGLVQGDQIRCVHLPQRLGVDGGEDAAVHRDQVRREGDGERGAGEKRQLLLDLRDVPVHPADAVGAEPLVHLAVEPFHLGAASRPGYAGLRVDDDGLRIDDLPLKKRGQPQDDAGRITAGVGDQRSLADLRAAQFGDAVDRLRQQLGV